MNRCRGHFWIVLEVTGVATTFIKINTPWFLIVGKHGTCVQVTNSYTTSWMVLILQPWLPRYPNPTLLALNVWVQNFTHHNKHPQGREGHCSVTFLILQGTESAILLKWCEPCRVHRHARICTEAKDIHFTVISHRATRKWCKSLGPSFLTFK